MILPDFGRFSFAEYVASGFNISGDTVLMFTCRAFAFVLPVFIVAILVFEESGDWKVRKGIGDQGLELAAGLRVSHRKRGDR